MIRETFAQLVEHVKKLLKTPLIGKKLVNSLLLSAFFTLIGDVYLSFYQSPRVMQRSLI